MRLALAVYKPRPKNSDSPLQRERSESPPRGLGLPRKGGESGMTETDVDLSFLDQQEEEEQDKGSTREQIGYALRKEQKRAKDAEKELAELRKFRDEKLAEARTEALKAAGISEGQAKYFQGEVTPEAVEAFKADLGIAVDAATEEAEESKEQARPEDLLKRPGFSPTAPAGAGPEVKLVSAEELAKLLKTDPARADRLVAEGKVALETEL